MPMTHNELLFLITCLAIMVLCAIFLCRQIKKLRMSEAEKQETLRMLNEIYG